MENKPDPYISIMQHDYCVKLKSLLTAPPLSSTSHSNGECNDQSTDIAAAAASTSREPAVFRRIGKGNGINIRKRRPTTTPTKTRTSTSQCCAARYCKNNRISNKDMSFFRFPKDEARSKIWAVNAGRPEILKKSVKMLYSGTVLCSVHFEDSQFNNPFKDRLKRDAVPTLFERPKRKCKESPKLVVAFKRSSRMTTKSKTRSEPQSTLSSSVNNEDEDENSSEELNPSAASIPEEPNNDNVITPMENCRKPNYPNAVVICKQEPNWENCAEVPRTPLPSECVVSRAQSLLRTMFTTRITNIKTRSPSTQRPINHPPPTPSPSTSHTYTNPTTSPSTQRPINHPPPSTSHTYTNPATAAAVAAGMGKVKVVKIKLNCGKKNKNLTQLSTEKGVSPATLTNVPTFLQETSTLPSSSSTTAAAASASPSPATRPPTVKVNSRHSNSGAIGKMKVLRIQLKCRKKSLSSDIGAYSTEKMSTESLPSQIRPAANNKLTDKKQAAMKERLKLLKNRVDTQRKTIKRLEAKYAQLFESPEEEVKIIKDMVSKYLDKDVQESFNKQLDLSLNKNSTQSEEETP